MLLQHGDDTAKGSMPIGVWVDMKEDNTGLHLTGKLALRTKRGAEAYALLRMQPRPALDGLSIGYRAKDSELHKAGSGPNGARRTLKSVDLVECSLVTFPADKYARASVKARPMNDEDKAKWAFEEFELLRSLTNRN
jgi:HK97 family phage prohead protease